MPDKNGWTRVVKELPGLTGTYRARWNHTMFGRRLAYQGNLYFDARRKRWEKRGVTHWKPQKYPEPPEDE